MKQTEMFRKAKPRACVWIDLRPVRICGEPAIVTIHKGAYCAAHAEKAQKYFGPSTPITV